ncbi:MAG TPA: DUF4337 family protein [Vicinamibacterales bacterium]|nr:DUF4337 family protein [Vicinamibacterales bacterium]
MEASELEELGDKMRGSEKKVGLTMAVIAAALAAVTLLGHRLHTDEIVMQSKAVDGWNYYQAKDSRSHEYANDARLAQLIGPQGASTAEEWTKKAAEEKSQAEDIRKDNDSLDQETQAVARHATFFDGAEICMEVALVLCSITILTEAAVFWQVSFLGVAVGLVLVAFGFLK